MLKVISSILSLFLIVIITFFAINNREIVEITLLPFTQKHIIPIYAIVLLSILFGFLVGVCMMSWGLLKAKFKNSSLHRKIKRSVEE